jgi:hypothetical protein
MPTQTKGWMHLNNGGINRPSLLSGGAQAKGQAPNSGRILADMEGRQATASPRAARVSSGGNRRLGLWLAIAGTVAVIAGLTVWGMSGSDDYREPGEYSLAPETPHATGHPDIPPGTPRDGAAMIVDAPAAAGDPALPAPAPMENATAPAEAAAATAAAGASTAATAPAASSRGAAPAARSSRSSVPAAGSKGKQDENLLGTLLGIIKEEDKTKAKAKSQPQNMDDLIAQIEADQRKRTEDERAAFERVASKKSASTESNIQAQLRACPSPASLKGVDCRRRICAAVSGKDPACPAM